jgi:hypothetical protein
MIKKSVIQYNYGLFNFNFNIFVYNQIFAQNTESAFQKIVAYKAISWSYAVGNNGKTTENQS